MNHEHLLLAIGTEQPIPDALMQWLEEETDRIGQPIRHTMLGTYEPVPGQDLAILVAPHASSSLQQSVNSLSRNIPTLIIGRPEERLLYPKASIWIDERQLSPQSLRNGIQNLTRYAEGELTSLLDTNNFFAQIRERLEQQPSLSFQLINGRIAQLSPDPSAHAYENIHSIFENQLRVVAPRHSILGRLGGHQYALVCAEENALNAHDLDITDISHTSVHISDPVTFTEYNQLGQCLQSCVSNMEQQRTLQQTATGSPNSWKESLVTQDLVRALRNQEFFLEFQPQFDTKTGHIMGAEALLRWQHPSLGLIPPTNFIPDAESSGLIREIGDWVMRESLLAWTLLHHHGLTLCMSVNVAFPEIATEGYADKVLDLLKEYRVPASCLELELTETAMMLDASLCRKNLIKLKRNGVRIALDDFGTGFSSLSHLNELPITAIKIDRGFVTPLGTQSDDHSQLHIVTTLIDLSHRLGLDTIVEGVEDQQCLNIVHRLGCERIQGFIYARPMSLEQLLVSAKKTQHPVYDLSGQISLF